MSGASRAAFATAVHIARTSGAELVLVHVFKMPLLADLYVSPKTYGVVEASGKAACMEKLTNLVTLARKRGVHARPVVVNGVSHREILRLAGRIRADLRIQGTHGRPGDRELPFASAERTPRCRAV